MSDVPQERADLPQEPYRPFPSFAEFASVDVELSTLAEFVAILDEAKAQATSERLAEAVRRATKWAAVDTGAIEGLYDVDRGFTFSVAATAAAWDAMDLKIGEAAARSINDALTAYDYVLDIVTDFRPITETWIKELHEVICASQETYKVLTAIGMQEQPLPKGEYKTQQNNPYNLNKQAVHNYAPVTDTPAEMHRMIEELGSAEFAAANPVLQAAYAHYAFVCIHPFADGNGRVARALASVYLYRSPGVPLVVFADQKGDYLDGLEEADAGSYGRFVRFVVNCAIDIVRTVGAEVRRSTATSLTDLRSVLANRRLQSGGLSRAEIDATARLLLDAWIEALTTSDAGNEVVDLIQFETAIAEGEEFFWFLDAYVPARHWVSVAATTRDSAANEITRTYRIGVARSFGGTADFVVARTDLPASERYLEDALIRELRPRITSALRFRLSSAAETELVDLIKVTLGIESD